MVLLLMLASAALCCCRMMVKIRAEVARLPATHACCHAKSAGDSAPQAPTKQHCCHCDRTNGLTEDRNQPTPAGVLAPTEPLAFVDTWGDAGLMLLTGRRAKWPDGTAPPRASTPVELHVLILS